MLIAKRKDRTFPSMPAFRRIGSKRNWAEKIVNHCESRPDLDNVATLWKPVADAARHKETEEVNLATPLVGYVYLMKHGSRREYKIGRTINPIRREGEIGIQLPEKLLPIHQIKTDDPAGVESYWHRRFASKRKEGEWFALNADDVQAFKRWKKIYGNSSNSTAPQKEFIMSEEPKNSFITDILGTKPVGEAIKIGTETLAELSKGTFSRLFYPALEEAGLLFQASEWLLVVNLPNLWQIPRLSGRILAFQAFAIERSHCLWPSRSKSLFSSLKTAALLLARR